MGEHAPASHTGEDQFVTHPEEDLFRCGRTSPGSRTPSGILRALDCGCARAFHRRVRTQHGYGSRRVLVLIELGLHERHRELRAQFRRQSRRRAQPTEDAYSADLAYPCHRRHRGQEGQALFRRQIWPVRTPSPSSNDQRNADYAASSHQGDGATATGEIAQIDLMP